MLERPWLPLFVLLHIGLSGRAASAQSPAAAPVNVCERMPGTEVAKAFGKTLRSQRSVAPKGEAASRCVYILAEAGKPDAPTVGLVLWHYPPADYDELKRVTDAKTEAVPGLGDAAMRFLDPGDGRHKLRVLRRGKFTLEATAPDADSALKMARLALERFDR